MMLTCMMDTVKLCKTATLKKTKNWFQDKLSLNAGQKYAPWEHSAIRLTFIKLSFAIKIIVLSIFEWPFFHRFYCTCKYVNFVFTVHVTRGLFPDSETRTKQFEPVTH